MEVVKNEMVIMVDCDDTLCMWSEHHTQPHEGALDFLDPYDGKTVYLKPHTTHIELVKQFKHRGYHVIIWSGAGYMWAEAVVKRLGLEKYVDQVMTKSTKYIDDLHADEILGSRIYLKYKE